MDNQYEQFISRQKKPSGFAKVVDPAASAIGAAAGMLLAGPAGAAAGYQIGHSVGNAAEQASNGTLTPESAAADVGGAYGGWKAMSPLFFAEGGMVPSGPAWDLLQQALERSQMPAQPQTPPDMSQMPGLLEQAAGPAPSAPTMQTARHPNLEMLATIIPQVLAAMPRPANPKNNRAIGAWLPAVGAAMSAPAAYAKGRREKANTAAQDAYDTQVEARNKIMAGAAPAIAGALTREPKAAAGDKFNRFSEPIPPEMVAGLKLPAWVKTYGQLDEYQQMMNRNATTSAAGPKQPSQFDLDKFALDVGTQYRLDPAAKQFETISAATANLMQSEPTSQGDLSMIFGYMKILDPTSVVREGEQESARKTTSIPGWLYNLAKKAESGQSLNPEQRANFISQARRYYDNAKRVYDRSRNVYSGYLSRVGLDPSNYLVDYSIPQQEFANYDERTKPKVPSAPSAESFIHDKPRGANGRAVTQR